MDWFGLVDESKRIVNNASSQSSAAAHWQPEVLQASAAEDSSFIDLMAEPEPEDIKTVDASSNSHPEGAIQPPVVIKYTIFGHPIRTNHHQQQQQAPTFYRLVPTTQPEAPIISAAAPPQPQNGPSAPISRGAEPVLPPDDVLLQIRDSLGKLEASRAGALSKKREAEMQLFETDSKEAKCRELLALLDSTSPAEAIPVSDDEEREAGGAGGAGGAGPATSAKKRLVRSSTTKFITKKKRKSPGGSRSVKPEPSPRSRGGYRPSGSSSQPKYRSSLSQSSIKRAPVPIRRAHSLPEESSDDDDEEEEEEEEEYDERIKYRVKKQKRNVGQQEEQCPPSEMIDEDEDEKNGFLLDTGDNYKSKYISREQGLALREKFISCYPRVVEIMKADKDGFWSKFVSKFWRSASTELRTVLHGIREFRTRAAVFWMLYRLEVQKNENLNEQRRPPYGAPQSVDMSVELLKFENESLPLGTPRFINTTKSHYDFVTPAMQEAGLVGQVRRY